jgi:glycosyltransferase involved in cell wall biosynthesis
MKIGIYISPAHMVPPDPNKILAPWVLAKEQVDCLVSHGHEVHLFAAMGSDTKGILHDFGVAPLVRKEKEFTNDEYKQLITEVEQNFLLQTLEVVKANNIAVLHVHHPIERLYEQLATTPKTLPIVFTFHDPVDAERFEMLKKIHDLGNCYFVGISNSQFRNVPIKFDFTVYNGVPISEFTYNTDLPSAVQYLSVGRIVPQKGFDDAIEAVRTVGGRLMIAGQVFSERPESLEYFNSKIKPHIDGGTVLLEPVLHRDHLIGHYQTARALLFPIKWEEPFGLVMIEAMACGTPVIAYNHGSVSEVIRDGVTGFIVNEKDTDLTDQNNTDGTDKKQWIIKKTGVEGLVEAINRIGEIDRSSCRKHVEEHFTIEKMVEGYEEVYKKVLGV